MTGIDLSKLERLATHLMPGEDLTLVVLKGHLLIEEMLDELIAAHCVNLQVIEQSQININFAVKLLFARALTGADELAVIWTACERLGSLRNTLAHKLEHPQTQKRLSSFLSSFDDPNIELKRTGDHLADVRRGIIFLHGALQALNKPHRLDGLGIAI